MQYKYKPRGCSTLCVDKFKDGVIYCLFELMSTCSGRFPTRQLHAYPALLKGVISAVDARGGTRRRPRVGY